MTLSWASAWAYFNAATDFIKTDFIRQIQLIALLQGVAPMFQVEIIEYATVEVIHAVKHHLHRETVNKLGV